MSVESARAFVERLDTDEEFAKKVAICKSKEERITLAKNEGYDFSVEEVKEALSQLSDDDLENVAGGSFSISQGITPSLCFDRATEWDCGDLVHTICAAADAIFCISTVDGKQAR